MGTCQSRLDHSSQLVLDLESGDTVVVMRALAGIQTLARTSRCPACQQVYRRALSSIDGIISAGPVDDTGLRDEFATTIKFLIEYYISVNQREESNICISIMVRFIEENPSVRYCILDSLLSTKSILYCIASNEELVVLITNALVGANREPDSKKPGGFRDTLRILTTFIRSSDKAAEYTLKSNILSTVVDCLTFIRDPFTCDSLIELLASLCEQKPELVVSDPQFVAILNKVFFSESIGLSSRALSATISLLQFLVELDISTIDATLIHSNLALSIPTLMIQSAPGMVSSESSLGIIETLLERAQRRVSESDFYKGFMCSPKKSLIAELKRLIEDSRSSPQEKRKAHSLLRLVSRN